LQLKLIEINRASQPTNQKSSGREFSAAIIYRKILKPRVSQKIHTILILKK